MRIPVAVACLVLSVVPGLRGQWSSPVPVNPGVTVYQEDPLIAVGPNREVVITVRERTSPYEIAVYRSTDNGSSFVRHRIPPPFMSEVVRADAISFDALGRLYVLWRWFDLRPLGDTYLVLSRSQDGGATFSTIHQDRSRHGGPSSMFIAPEMTVYIVWDTVVSGSFNSLKVLTRFPADTPALRSDKYLPQPADSAYTQLSQPQIYVAQQLLRYCIESSATGNEKAYISYSSDGGASFTPLAPLDTGRQVYPNIVPVAPDSVALTYMRLIGPDAREHRGRMDPGPAGELGPPFRIGERLPYGPLHVRYTQGRYHLVYASYGSAYYEDRQRLWQATADSFLFSGYFDPQIAVDTLGGKYVILRPASQQRVHFTRKDVISSVGRGVGDGSGTNLNARIQMQGPHGATVEFGLSEAQVVRLELYDVNGRKIRTHDAGTLSPGRHELRVSLHDLASGMYFVRLVTNSQSTSWKLPVVR